MKLIYGVALIFISILFFQNNLYSSVFIEKKQSFSQSKKLMKKVYYDQQKDFYCDCDYNYKQIKGKEKTVVDPSNCGYIARKNTERSKYIEWEHIVPAHAFGNTRICWREPICTDNNGKKFKGRKCCNKIDEKFNKMESDMHNLVPAIGELNADRSNFSFTILSNPKKYYGACDFYVSNKSVQPKADIRGDIARAYFYMEDEYGVKISDKQRKLFNIWNTADKVSTLEKIRNERIKQIQGNRNKFIG